MHISIHCAEMSISNSYVCVHSFTVAVGKGRANFGCFILRCVFYSIIIHRKNFVNYMFYL